MPSGGGGASSPKLPKQAVAINKLRLGQEQSFDPFRQQAQGLFGSLLNPYGAPSYGPAGGAGTAYGAGGFSLPGYSWQTPPTPGTPGTEGTPFMSSRDVARQAFISQMGREPRRDRQLDKFIRRSGKRGVTFADQAAVEGTPGTPGTPGVLSQNPFDEAIRATYGKLPGMGDLRFSSPEQAFAASQLAALTDTSSLQSAADKTLENVVGPQLLAKLTASGLGRSGAVGEALANAGAGMALPIAQQGWAGQQNLANYIGQLGQGRQQLITNTATPSLTGSPLSIIGGTGSTPSGGSSVAGTIGAIGAGLGGLGTLAGTALPATLGGGTLGSAALAGLGSLMAFM